MGAAVAIKNLMDEGKIKGTIRFYGTPAEEKFFGKLWRARAGLFDDLDACLDWHPADHTSFAAQHPGRNRLGFEGRKNLNPFFLIRMDPSIDISLVPSLKAVD